MKTLAGVYPLFESRTLWARLQLGTLLAACLLYIVQVWTPLRLTGDSIVLLSIASSAADGHGFLDNGQRTHYPPGYPAMVVCLERVGAARPWGLVGLNALFLIVASVSWRYVARHDIRLTGDWATTTLLFTALSFALIKHFTLPLTDIPFFGIGMLALALLIRGEREPGSLYYVFWTGALLSSIAGVLVRPVAIALFPCLVWSLARRTGFGDLLRLNKTIVLIVSCTMAALAAFAVSVLLLRTRYVQEALSVITSHGVGHGIRNILLFRVHEIGELSLNVPASRLGALAPLVWLAGAAVIAAFMIVLRPCSLGLSEIYLAGYVFIMLLWPYSDTRFWTPVLPLIFAELFSFARPWTFTGWKRRAGMLYAAAYLLTGFVALSYSTRITFSGRQFPLRYGDDHIRPTYEMFYSIPKADTSKGDEKTLELLQRYSRRGRP